MTIDWKNIACGAISSLRNLMETKMSAAANKELMQEIYDELSKGNRMPFRNAMAEDFRWIMKGKTAWSRTYEGRDAVRNELINRSIAQFADEYANTAIRIFADGDYVIVECEGSRHHEIGQALQQSVLPDLPARERQDQRDDRVSRHRAGQRSARAAALVHESRVKRCTKQKARRFAGPSHFVSSVPLIRGCRSNCSSNRNMLRKSRYRRSAPMIDLRPVDGAVVVGIVHVP